MLVEDGLDAAGFFSEVNFVISSNEDSFDAGGVSAAVVTLAQSVIANNDATGGRGDDLCSINPGVYTSQGGNMITNIDYATFSSPLTTDDYWPDPNNPGYVAPNHVVASLVDSFDSVDDASARPCRTTSGSLTDWRVRAMAHYPKPFFKKSRGAWYVEINRRQHNLGTDKDEAFCQYHARTELKLCEILHNTNQVRHGTAPGTHRRVLDTCVFTMVTLNAPP